MRKKMKRILSITLVAVLVMSMISVGNTVAAEVSATYTHGTAYKSIYDYFYKNKQFPTDYADGESYFTYLFGSDGNYQNLKKCYTYYGWTNNWALGWSETEATYPGVNAWFMAVSPDKQSVIDFHAEQSGALNITANGVYASATGVEMMIVQRRGNKFCPLYPVAGSYEWKAVPLKAEQFDLDITTTVEKGDEILVIAGGNVTQILGINPTFAFTGENGTALESSAFSPWGTVPGTTNTRSGWYAYQNKNPYYDSPWTFMGGKDGEFSKLTNFITTNGNPYYWASLSDVQDPAAAYIKPEQQGAGINNWAVTAYTATSDCYLYGKSDKSLTVVPNDEDLSYDNGSPNEEPTTISNADFMVVLKNSQGKYYPVYPTAGVFQWQTVKVGDTVNPTFETYCKKGDSIYYIVKPEYTQPGHITNVNPTVVTLHPSIDVASASFSSYPDDMVFGDFPQNYYYDETRPQDIALTPASISNDLSDEKYLPENRCFEGIPRCVMLPGGRMFMTFTTGGMDEGPGNYSIMKYSDDNGESWTSAATINHSNEFTRVFDPVPFVTPEGELWILYNQSYLHSDGREGVWVTKCSNPQADAKDMIWTDPVRVCNGMIVHDPIVTKDGRYLFTAEIVCFTDTPYNYIPEDRCNTIYELAKDGNSVTSLAKLTVPDRNYTEAVLTEKSNGELLFYARRAWGYNIGQATSTDGGYTWTAVTDSGIKHPSSLFDIVRLQSGNLLMVNHYNFSARDNLTAMISRDDGETWEGFLLLDERSYSSYPDICQASDGRIYVVYDRDRYNAKEILMASFTEADVLAGTPSDTTVLKKLVDKAMGIRDTESYGHGGMFVDSDRSGAYSISHSGAQFTYEYGKDGSFSPLNQYVENQWWKAWTLNGSDPKISPWFVSGSNQYDGALIWKTAAAGEVTVTSSQKLATDGEGKTAQMMVLQRRKGKYYPIYPAAGEFVWLTVDNTETGFPTIKTTVNDGDDIVFVVRSNNHIIKLSPQIAYTKNAGTSLPDSIFTAWDTSEENKSTTRQIHSVDFYSSNKSVAKSTVRDGSYFTYEMGYDGGYVPFKYYSTSTWVGEGNNGVWMTYQPAMPWVATWHIGAGVGLDGVIRYHSANSGIARISSGGEVYSSIASGSSLMIVQKRGGSYYPVYPIAGKFEWQPVTDEKFTLPTITADIYAGDEILFIVRSEKAAIVAINPEIVFTKEDVSDARGFLPWPKRTVPLVACVGDSITQSVAVSSREVDGYPAKLQEALGDNYKVANFGSSGALMTLYTERVCYDASLAANPDIVVLMLGTNDIMTSFWDGGTVNEEKFKAAARSLIIDYRSLSSKPEVILMNTPAMYGDPNRTPEKEALILQCLTEVAEEMNCKMIDMHNFTTGHSDWFADALHPNAAGNAEIGSFVAEELYAYYRGDVNCDTDIDVRDLVRMKKYFSNIQTETNLRLYDINSDSSIDALDLEELCMKLLTAEDIVFDGNNRICVFSEEFSGNNLDTYSWNYRTGNTWYSTSSADAVSVSNGNLVISCTTDGSESAASGGIISKRSFGYGYYEASIKLDLPNGWHPSFWTYAVNNSSTALESGTKYTEIDICEYDLGTLDYCAFNVHGFGETTMHKNVHVAIPADLREGYHIYGCDYSKDGIVFYLDGNPVSGLLDISEFPVNPQYVWLSCIAYKGVPQESGTMYVDYFRYYK